jgi:hypothetical protein
MTSTAARPKKQSGSVSAPAEYEIDLNAANATRLRNQLAPFINHARKSRPGRRSQGERTAASRQDSAKVRAWAREQGIEIRERGRIPATVTTQYEAASIKG